MKRDPLHWPDKRILRRKARTRAAIAPVCWRQTPPRSGSWRAVASHHALAVLVDHCHVFATRRSAASITYHAPMASFWESPESVERFAARQPDVRLGELIREYSNPSKVRVLDLGCAAGRNAFLLAERGFDVEAVDGSAAMVAKTRERLTPILGAAEAQRRVRVGRME